MNEPCGIVRDLLPLYAEHMAGEASAALVEAHIKACEQCKNELDAMTQENTAENHPEQLPLTAVRAAIKRRRARTRRMAALIVFLFAVCVFSFLTKPVYIPYTDALCSVTQAGDGVYVKIDQATNCRVEMFTDPDSGAKSAGIEAWSSVLDGWMTGKSASVAWIQGADSVYYCDAGADGAFRRIFGPTGNEGGGTVALPRLVLGYYFLLAAGGAAVLLVLWLFLRKKKAGAALRILLCVPTSYLVSSLLIMGMDFSTFSPIRSLLLILLAALAVFFILLTGCEMLKERA